MKLISKIFLILFFLVPVLVHAEKADFIISAECESEYSSTCNVIKIVNGENETLMKNIRLNDIEKINSNLYLVKASCGSPCSWTFFYSRTQKDSTDEFIAFDKQHNCLIESDSRRKKIYARTIFLDKERKELVNLNSKKFNSILISKFDYYRDFREKSYFDKLGNFYLIASQDEKILLKQKTNNPCGSIKK